MSSYRHQMPDFPARDRVTALVAGAEPLPPIDPTDGGRNDR